MTQTENRQSSLQFDSTPLHRPVIKCIGLAVCLCLIGLSLIWLRAVQESRQAYRNGIACLERAEWIPAVTFFDRSIHWYAPFNPFPERSAQRLWEVAHHGDKTGDTRLACIATRAIRRGFLATGGLYTPGRAWIERAEEKLTGLTSESRADAAGKTSTPEIGTKQQRRPDIVWTLVLEIGFIGWILSVGVFLFYRLKDDADRGLGATAGLACGIPFLLFYALWIVGMAKA